MSLPYQPSTYGDRIADQYDVLHGDLDPTATVDLLAELASGGPVLELGIGTGRVALPLSARGVAVHGLDASERMVSRLREKPGGADIPVTLGDFRDFRLGERFSLVYVPFNTFFALLTQDDQVQCFRCVAAHLRPGGRFLLECFVPDQTRFTRGQATYTHHVDTEQVYLEFTQHDPVAQRSTSQLVTLREDGIRMHPVQIRYAWPSELDLMARLAGMELEHRWDGGWRREPFTARSTSHVSVYRVP